MLIYVIPLIILIVVLLVLKKRQDSQGTNQAKPQKGKAQKANSVKKTTHNTTVVKNDVVEKRRTTPLAPDTRKKIETLIQEHNFFAAEAQINQALNKDNSQHELYLFLLDIHIQQKDEFAISQLINHLRSLELDEILSQAEAKKEIYENSLNTVKDSIDFKLDQSSRITNEPTHNADFDSLMEKSSLTSNQQAFEQLQQSPVSIEKPIIEEIKPLDFSSLAIDTNIQAVAPIVEIEQPKNHIEPLSFDTLSTNETPIIDKVEASPVPEIKPLDFASFKLDTTIEESSKPVEPETQTLIPTTTADIQPLDFSTFSLESETKSEETTESLHEIKPLDFSFSVDSTPPSEPTTAITDFTELSFNVTENLSELKSEATPTEITPEYQTTSGIVFDLPNVSIKSVTTDPHDPLIQSFPELIETDETALNLVLAQQYIQFGAFESAREILAEKDQEYSPEQRQQAELLLNQIAS